MNEPYKPRMLICSIFLITWPINSLKQSDTYCISKLTIIGLDNGLSPGRCQAITSTNAGILSTISTNAGLLLIISTNAGIISIWNSGTNFDRNLKLNPNIFIQQNEFENVCCEMATILSWPQCVKTQCNRLSWKVKYRIQNSLWTLEV